MNRPAPLVHLFRVEVCFFAIGFCTFFALAQLSSLAAGAESQAVARFRKDVQPILVQYCYDCHGDGMSKGKVAFDELKSEADLLGKPELWSAVLKNLRANLMPPQKKPRPSQPEQERIANWIKYDAFGIDPNDPDPGRVTIRRLNRVEYRNTIRDLMGFDFKAEDELPPDDTGYGFDNIGDVLTVSPMLLEKYMQGAETIVGGALPRMGRVVNERTIPGSDFKRTEGEGKGDLLTFYKEATSAHTVKVAKPGDYHLIWELEVTGQFDFDPGRCRVTLKADGQERKQQEFGWYSNKRFSLESDHKWSAGEHRLALELHPLTPMDRKVNSLDLRIITARVQGPLEKKEWVRPKNFTRFFTQDPPANAAERHRYTRQVLSRFTEQAWRRPVEAPRIDRLVAIAEAVSKQPGKGFVDGIGQAMVAVLSSPRFLFRVEDVESKHLAAATQELRNIGARASRPQQAEQATAGGTPTLVAMSYPLVDEYALASRLSYFLWSTMPDEELFRLAASGELRKNLHLQATRMLADRRSEALVENFTGQWLQARDVEGIDINERVVLARDSGQEKELIRQRQEFLAQFTNRLANANQKNLTNNASQTNGFARGNRRRRYCRGCAPDRRYARPFRDHVLDQFRRYGFARRA